jgi:hypothetical protein
MVTRQAADLRDEFERRQAQLRQYRQVLEDLRSLKNTTGGINLDEGNIGIPHRPALKYPSRK